jgi:hypothetical protein
MMNTRAGSRIQVDVGLDELFHDVQLDQARGAISFGDQTVDVSVGSEIQDVLSAYIYSKFHSRSNGSASEKKWSTYDPQVEAQIAQVTPRRTGYKRVKLLETVTNPDGVFGHYFGLRTFFPEERCVAIGSTTALVKIQTVLPAISIGFFHYTGLAGPGNSEDLLRIYYASEEPAAAIQAWMKLISFADGAMIPFRAKILSRSSEYPRSDAIVIYLPPESWDRTNEICQILGAECSSDLTSAFTVSLQEGVGVSWEPYVESAKVQRKSFGEHRSSAVAKGYLDALLYEVDLDSAVRSNLISANIDPLQIYRNLNSPSLFLDSSKKVREFTQREIA